MRIQRLLTLSTILLVAISASAVPALASGSLDQEYDSGFGLITAVNGSNQKAQLFTSGVSGTLDQVELAVSNYGTSSAVLTMTLQTVSGGVPSGTALATASVPRGSTQNNGSWVSFVLTSPIDVAAGTEYAIVLSTAEANANNGYGWATNSTNSYTRGAEFSSSNAGTSWSTVTGYDLGFRTYVTAADSGGTPPVMQQFGMPSSGTCDAAAPVMLNWGGAGSGGWGNSWAQWANGGNGGPVCTRTLVYSNAAGRWIVG